MIKKITPKTVKIKSKAYGSKPMKRPKNASIIGMVSGNTINQKRQMTLIREVNDIEVMYSTDDKRKKFRQWTQVNGFITAYLREFKESDFIVMTEIAEQFNVKGESKGFVPINEMRFMIAPHKVLKVFEPNYDELLTAIIRNSMVIGLYPAQDAKDWDKGIDLLDEFKLYDFGMNPQAKRPNINKIALTISEKKKQIQDRTVFDDNPRKGII